MNIEDLRNIFKECEIVGEKVVLKSDLAKFLELLKNTYNFNLLKDITAIDYKESGIELTYRLFNIIDEEEVLVSITVQKEAESVSYIFDSAIADEKEIYDLFGINFIGNKELKRLYMPESWEGHPLKKDYENNDERLSWND